MSIELVQMSKNTRGKDSRTITYMGIGRPVERKIDRETAEDGSPLGKDENGNQITREEIITELTHEGVVTTVEEAMELVGNDTKRFLDCFADGFNREAYRIEADKDELDPYVLGLEPKAAKARKTVIRGLAKTLGIGVLDAAEIVKMATPQAATEEVSEPEVAPAQ